MWLVFVADTQMATIENHSHVLLWSYGFFFKRFMHSEKYRAFSLAGLKQVLRGSNENDALAYQGRIIQMLQQARQAGIFDIAPSY